MAQNIVENPARRAEGLQPNSSLPIFYGWWIVLAASLNLFFVVGIMFYGFPVFYPSIIQSLGFTRSQLTTGFLLGFVVVALPVGIMAGALIDRFGPRRVIWVGIWLVSASLLLMASMTRLWHFYLLCMLDVFGYVLSGPVANQVLISNWFRQKRGRAMGYAYLGLGLGGAVSPLAIQKLIQLFGWRHALQVTGVSTLLVLFPVAQWVTKSNPRDVGLAPDGESLSKSDHSQHLNSLTGTQVQEALRSRNFWLIVIGSTLTIGAIGAVTQHLILFLRDNSFSLAQAAQVSSTVLATSLAGRVIVGHFADHRSKKNVMATFYLLLAAAIPLLFLTHQHYTVWIFALMFGFALGADYMLIPLLTAECFGLTTLGRLLAIISSLYALGQWLAPFVTGKLFDAYHNYDLAWGIMTGAAFLGASVIYAISPRSDELRSGN